MGEKRLLDTYEINANGTDITFRIRVVLSRKKYDVFYFVMISRTQ